MEDSEYATTVNASTLLFYLYPKTYTVQSTMNKKGYSSITIAYGNRVKQATKGCE